MKFKTQGFHGDSLSKKPTFVRATVPNQILMRQSLCVLFLLIYYPIIYSQQKLDTLKIKDLLAKAELLEGAKPDSALLLEKEALRMAKAGKREKWQAEAYYYMGWAFMNQGQYDGANNALDSAIYLYRRLGELQEVPKCYNGKAAVYQQLGDYPQAAKQYLTALQVLENLPNASSEKKVLENIAKIQFNVAVTFKQSENYPAAEKYLQKATDFYLTQRDTDDYLGCLNNYSSLYAAQKDTVKEFYYIEKAFSILSHYNKADTRTQEAIFSNYGKMLDAKGQLEEGLKYKEKGLALALSHGAFYAARTAPSVGEAYLALKRYGDAQRCQQIIQAYAEKSNSHRAYADAYYLQSKIDRALGNHERAYEHLLRYNSYIDSVLSTDKSKAVAQLERQFETAKKDNLLLENKLTIQQQKQWIGGSLLGILLLASLLVMLWQYQQTKRKQHAHTLLQVQQQQELKTMKALITGEENERSRIAKELHDSVGGLLSTVRLHFDALRTRSTELKQNTDYEYALSLLDNSSQYIRQISHHLMPEILTRYNLIKALETYCENIQRSKMLELDFQYFGIAENERFSPSFELMVYRIVQELLSNIIKHARATTALLQINRHENLLSIAIEDNGKGFDPQSVHAEATGMGLRGIEQKIKYLGGQMDIDAKEGMGTSIFIELILQNQGA